MDELGLSVIIPLLQAADARVLQAQGLPGLQNLRLAQAP